MTAEEMMEKAKSVRDDEIDYMRHRFQRRYPHYTPNNTTSTYWYWWKKANIQLHGEQGFKARFSPFDGTNRTLGGVSEELLEAARCV